MSSKARNLVVALAIALLAFGVFGAAFADQAGGADADTQAAASKSSTSQTARQRFNSDPAYRANVTKWNRAAVTYRNKAAYWRHQRFTPGHVNSLHVRFGFIYDVNAAARRAKIYRWANINHWRAYQREAAIWNARNADIHKAIWGASRAYGVSASWLHACVHSEGGHGRWVWNTSGSGAGGWFQFMRGTFYGYVHKAQRGKFPARFKNWNSRVGQAYTAAYMFKIGESKQWTGHGC